MKPTLHLGRIGGVDVGVHWSVGVILTLVAWALGAGLLPAVVEDQSAIAYGVAGVFAAVGLVASILLHELSHVVIAKRDGVEVERITLWMLGGMAELGSNAKTARSELRIALAGPLSSLAIGATFVVAANAAAALGIPELATATLAWLALANIMLALFNLLPGAPLDGGRVVAALLWRRSGNEHLARWRSARAGSALGQALIVLGLVLIALFGRFDGLWLALIGWFLVATARAEATAARLALTFGDLAVGEVMSHPVETFDGGQTIATFVANDLMSTRVSTLLLVDAGGSPTGVLTIRQLRSVPRERWGVATLADVATPRSQMTIVAPTDRLVDALATATSTDGRLVVVEAGRLVGLVTPTDVTRALTQHSLTQTNPRGHVPLAAP